MKIRGIKIFILVAGLFTILSCQKEIDGTNGGTIVLKRNLVYHSPAAVDLYKVFGLYG